MRARARALWARTGLSSRSAGLFDAGILDLFEELVYVGEITPDGHYIDHSSSPMLERVLGGNVPDGMPAGTLWESLIHPEDVAAFEQFNRRQLDGEEAELTYRLIGLDGVTRILWDRARPQQRADGSVLVRGIISDLTTRREADARLAEASERFTGLLDVVGEHVYLALAGLDGRFEEQFQGPGADRLLGGADPDAEMANWEAAVHPDDRAGYHSFLQACAAGEESEAEYRLIGADGITRWVHDRAATRPRDDGTIEISGIVADVTERRRLRAELDETLRRSMAELEHARSAAELRARTDELTAVFNRRHFAEIVGEALASDATGWGLLILDADHFKQVNDAHGHVVGDAVLVELARRIAACLGPGDCLARWGGEEFAVLLAGIASEGELDRRAQRLRTSVAASPVAAAGVSVRLTISVGAARASAELDNLDALVETADRCLYVAKRHGRNRVSLVPNLAVTDAPAREPEAVCMARALAVAAEVREGMPAAHAEQVALLATLTAERMALPVGVVLRCRLGGWLHDAGKAAVPERILEKRGPLDESEWAIVKTHPIVGEEILLRVAALAEAAAAVRHHHERYDGSGYPDRLAGVAIPIEARIVAAADAYSTMTAERRYSAARTPHEAAAELRRSAGSHLDPGVVAALLDVLELVARPRLKVA